MKITRSIIAAFTIILLCQTNIYSQAEEYSQDLIESLDDFRRVGQAAMPFLKFGAGARTMAMGDAVNSLKGDPSALFYNPAGLAYAKEKQLMFSHTSWLLDTSLMAGAASMDLGDWGVFGLSLLYYDYGDPIIATEIDGTKQNGYNVIGEMNPIEMFVGLGYGRRISDKFAIGGQVKIAHQNLLGSGGVQTRTATLNQNGEWERHSGDAKQTIVAFDFGTIYDTGWRGLSFSMAFRNFGKEIKYQREKFDLPLSFRFGISCNMMGLLNYSTDEHSLVVSIDRIHPRDWSERMNFGVEYALKNFIFLRAGYKQNYSSEGLTLGTGIRWNMKSKMICLDYAFKDTDYTLDYVHVTSMSFKF